MRREIRRFRSYVSSIWSSPMELPELFSSPLLRSKMGTIERRERSFVIRLEEERDFSPKDSSFSPTIWRRGEGFAPCATTDLIPSTGRAARADYYASPFAPISFSYPGLTGPIELAFSLSLSSNRLPSSSSSSAGRASRLRIGGRNYCDIESLPPRSIRYVWMTSPFGHAALRVAHV